MTEMIVGMGAIAFGNDGDLLIAQGLGSCVGVIIYEPETKIAAMAHVMLPDSRGSDKPTTNKTVLLAEHDVDVRRHIRDILASNGFEILAESTDKDEVIQHYRRHRPAVSLISAFLPPEEGPSAIQKLLTVDHGASVVILSPMVNRSAVVSYLNLGVRGVLTNPFTEDKVIKHTERALHRGVLKFADVAIPTMIRQLQDLGVKKTSIRAKVFGGAHMFPNLREETLNVGEKNVAAVKDALEAEGIAIDLEDTGKDYGRTIIFNVSEGAVHMRTKDGTKRL